MPKIKGKPTQRESRSQLAQLNYHQHGNEKGVKWPMATKDGSSDKSGPTKDTGLKGFQPGIVAKIQRLLDSDKDLSVYGIKASSANNTLQLTGIVDTLADKKRVKSLLARAGIGQFRDEISTSTDGEFTDTEVVLEVREELEADPELAATHISVECSGGTVFLHGNVENRGQENAAIAAAGKSRGATRVISHLSYLPGNMETEFRSSSADHQRLWGK